MTRLCSIEGCDRLAKLKGKCQRCYQREYWRSNNKNAALPETRYVPAEAPAVIPPELNAEIDALTPEQLNHWVMEKIYGWLPPNDPRNIVAWRAENPNKKRLPHYGVGWRTPAGGTWSRNPAGWLVATWELIGYMRGLPSNDRFLSMVRERDILLMKGSEDASPFITRCALKAFLMPRSSPSS
jgi:hypothetical protein